MNVPNWFPVWFSSSRVPITSTPTFRRWAVAPGNHENSSASSRLPVLVCWGSPLLRSEEHTSELQSRLHLVCRLLLEKKKKHHIAVRPPRTLARGHHVRDVLRCGGKVQRRRL